MALSREQLKAIFASASKKKVTLSQLLDKKRPLTVEEGLSLRLKDLERNTRFIPKERREQFKKEIINALKPSVRTAKEGSDVSGESVTTPIFIKFEGDRIKSLRKGKKLFEAQSRMFR